MSNALPVAEVLVFIHRPVTLSEAELRVWLTERARRYEPELIVAEADHSPCQVGLLRVEVEADSVEGARAELSELIMDMRLVGLRPAFASSLPWTTEQATQRV